MRFFLLLVLLASVTLLVLQNGQFQALVLFGYSLPALPVAVWMASAIAAGILTSAVLQLLNYRPKRSVRTPRREAELPPEPREPFPERITDSPRSTQVPPRETASDWDSPASQRNEGWGEPLPRPQPDLRKDVRPEPPKVVPPPPQRPSSPPTDNSVFDANYRVINPPIPEPPSQAAPKDENEEDWGFPEEEIESDYRRQFRDRD